MQEYFLALLENIKLMLPNIFAALFIVLLSIYAAKILGAILENALKRNNTAPGISHLLAQTLKWTVIGFGIITAAQRFFDITAFLTGLGIIGFTVGFAMQNIMQNFVSGVILLVQQPFSIGDDVRITGYEGTIIKIDLRTTEMKTLDGLIVFLPNADILSQPIVNYTRALQRRVELPVGVAYNSNPEKVRAICLEAVTNVTGFMNEPEPQILFQNFGASSIDLMIYFWVNTETVSTRVARNEALTKIKQAFENEKIEIPYPIQTVRMSQENMASTANKRP